MGLMEYAQMYSQEVDFPIFVGAEYYSKQGDILVFGIDALPEPNLTAQQLIDRVNALGGICIAAHPFRNNNRGLEENLRTVKGLTAIEVLNGSASMEANRKALQYARELGIQAIGSSDAHNVIQVGRYATWMPDGTRTMSQFISALKQQLCHPAILKGYVISDTF